MASKGVGVVITGTCGPNAERTLSAAGIELFTGQTGTIKEAIERYKNGELRSTLELNVYEHNGTAEKRSVRDMQGKDFGRGMGRGRGRGKALFPFRALRTVCLDRN